MTMRNAYRAKYGSSEKLGRLKVNAKIMVDKTNYLLLPQMVQYWRDDLQVDIVAIRLVQDIYYGEQPGAGDRYELTEKQRNELTQLIKSKYPKDPDLSKFAHFLQLRQEPSPTTKNCFNVTQGHFAVIDARGDIYLGNPEIGKLEYSIGNINQQKWTDIWGSQRHRAIIQKMNTEQQKNTCNKAFCRHTTANQGVQEYLDGKRQAPNEQKIMKDDFGAFM